MEAIYISDKLIQSIRWESYNAESIEFASMDFSLSDDTISKKLEEFLFTNPHLLNQEEEPLVLVSTPLVTLFPEEIEESTAVSMMKNMWPEETQNRTILWNLIPCSNTLNVGFFFDEHLLAFLNRTFSKVYIEWAGCELVNKFYNHKIINEINKPCIYISFDKQGSFLCCFDKENHLLLAPSYPELTDTGSLLFYVRNIIENLFKDSDESISIIIEGNNSDIADMMTTFLESGYPTEALIWNTDNPIHREIEFNNDICSDLRALFI